MQVAAAGREINSVDIDGERLLRDLRRLAQFGKYRTGVDRVAFSPEDVAARAWLSQQLAEIGLEVATDRYGTVLGRWPGVDRAILLGSHTDTVPRGGWLDGAMGVVYALEIARALREQGKAGGIGVDVVSFQDEEGTYLSCLGSKAFCGLLDVGDVGRARNTDGQALSAAISRAGFAGEPIRAPPGRYLGFLEAHIEQGPRLITSGRKIASVTGFVGIRRISVEAEGRADHAGTTPMTMRADAAAPLFRFASWVQDAFPALAGADTVWNIGNFTVSPGAANVVPSRAGLTLEFRDVASDMLDRLEAAVLERVGALQAGSGVRLGTQLTARLPPTRTDPGLLAVLEAAARAAGTEPLAMQSGAGHDAMILAGIMPSAMLFVPSIGGRSHDIEENTDDADIVFGAQVLARAVEQLVTA